MMKMMPLPAGVLGATYPVVLTAENAIQRPSSVPTSSTTAVKAPPTKVTMSYEPPPAIR